MSQIVSSGKMNVAKQYAAERDEKMRLTITQGWNRIKRRAAVLPVLCHSRIVSHQGGQDLIEYALMAATIAVATAAIFPQSIAPNICAIFSKVNSTLGSANN